MIKKEKREVTEEKEYPVSIICDVCSKEYSLDEKSENYDVFETQEFTHIHFTGGYGSVFGDGRMVELDICQHCLKEKMGGYIREVGDAW